MIKWILGLVVLASSGTAFAQEFSIEGGFRQQSGELATGVSAKPVTGYQFGGLAYLPISGEWHFRTGLFYTQRTIKGEVSSPSRLDLEYKMNYVDVPLTAFYKFSDQGGIFGGVILSNNFEKSWSVNGASQADKDVKSLIFPFVVGASFKFVPQFGMSVYYEFLAGEAARDLKNYKAVGVNLAFYFE